jgi:FMN reductase
MSEDFSILIITGSPLQPSRCSGLAELIERRLSAMDCRVELLHVRDLPPEALFYARFDDAQVKSAAERVARADGIIVLSPVYKAAYTGTFKAFVDLLPQFALREKVVLPLLIGGSLAHVLALDYAVRPMLQSLDPRLIVSGLFLLDKTIDVSGSIVALAPDVAERLEQVLQSFLSGLTAHRPARASEPCVMWE